MTIDKPSGRMPDKNLQKNKRLKNIFLGSTIVLAIIAVILGVLLALSLTGIINIPAIQIGSRSTGVGSKAYDKPEEVIDQFVLAIQKNDFDKATSLFAIDNLVEGYDFEAYLERVGAFMPLNAMAPEEYGPYTGLNRAYQLNSASNQIKMFAFSLLLPEVDLIRNVPLKELEDNEIDLLNQLDPSQLESLDLVRADYSSPENQNSDRYQESIERLKKAFGFIDQEEYIALYDYDGDYYVGGFVLVEYTEGWQISGLGAPLAGLNFYGLQPITESEYLDIIGE